MLKILALFAVASAELPCPANANASTYCKNAGGYVGKCTSTNAAPTVFGICTVSDTECASKGLGDACGGIGISFGKCETAGGKCKYAECPAAPAVAGGTLTCNTDVHRVPGSDVACTLACNANYTKKTDSTYKCSATGAWTGVAGMCEQYCPAAPAVTGGTLNCSAAAMVAGSDTACTLSCGSSGYRVKTDSTLKCSAAGAWTGVPGACEQVCPAAPAVTGGTLNCSAAAMVAGSGTACTLSCGSGYSIKTATGRMCSAAGAWTGVAGECEVSSSSSSSSTKDSDHSAAISTATAIVVAAFALH